MIKRSLCTKGCFLEVGALVSCGSTGRRNSMTCPHHRATKLGRKDSSLGHLAPELAILEGQHLSGSFDSEGRPLDSSWAGLGTLPPHLLSWSFTLCSGGKPTSALTSFHSLCRITGLVPHLPRDVCVTALLGAAGRRSGRSSTFLVSAS